MSILSTYAKKYLPGTSKTLLKAGFLNGDLEPTNEGLKALFTAVLENEAIAASLEEMAKEVIKDNKENQK